MNPLRRVVGLVTGFLVLQLALLGAAAPCAEQTAHSDHAVTVAASETDAAPAAPSECAEHSDKSGEPVRTGGPSCIAMISCVIPMVQLAVEPSLAASIVAFDPVVAPDLEPLTRNPVPEPPPPRA